MKHVVARSGGRSIALACAAAFVWWPLHAPRPALADEARAHVRTVPDARGLVIAVADSSAAAQASVEVRAATASAGGCPSGRVYWRRGGGPPPPCESAQWVPVRPASAAAGLRCADANAELAARGYYVAARLRQWDQSARQWVAPSPGSRGALECVEDSGRHGAEAGAWLAADGGAAPWSGLPSDEIGWDEDAAAYTLYSSAYVAAWYSPARESVTAWEVERAALASLDAAAYDAALLRHSWNGEGSDDTSAEGGMVVSAAGSARTTWLGALRSIVPGGGAPWTETLYEATRYLRGEAVDFGLASRSSPDIPQPSVRASRVAAEPARYAEPIRHACSRVQVLALPAGTPSQDEAGRARVLALPGLEANACDGDAAAPCLPALLRFLERTDHSRLPGAQHARVHWAPIGTSGHEAAGLAATMDSHWALDARDRVDAIGPYLASLSKSDLAAPAIAVAADDRPSVGAIAAAPGEAFAAFFRASHEDRWLGGVAGLGRASTGGVETRATFAPASPARRRLYTDVAGADLTAAGNAVDPANAALTAEMLGLAPAELARRARTLAWARGVDTEDADSDGDREEARVEIGAVVGGSLAVVRHASGSRVYAGTGDGVLHAFDAAGAERWAFVPRAFLSHLDELRIGRRSGVRHAGLDAELRVLVVDRNGDGVVDASGGERAILYFGLRRGGRAYLAIDVTQPDAPRRLWTLTPRDLPGLAQTWATPVPARLTIAGSGQNADRRVVLLTGGHDPAQDSKRSRVRDRVGAALYLVDAYSGALLWHASGRAADAPDLVAPFLDHAIAATPRALDVNEDGELDRAYVADTGGRLFRFDFRPGGPRDALATATLLADLGGRGADDRRFYAEPDVALVRQQRGVAYLAITLGSGFAPDPNAPDADNRLYSIRDTLGPPAAAPVLTDEALPAASGGAIARDARGWKLPLGPRERILVTARTIDHRVHVPAYAPPTEPLTAECVARTGTNQLHVVDVRDARRVEGRSAGSTGGADGGPGGDTLPIDGVAPPVAVVALGAAGCTGDCAREVVGLVGLERVDVRWPGRIVRTGWAERGVE